MSLDTAADPYVVAEDLAPRIDALGLRGNVRDLVDHGYTIIQDRDAHALTDDVRAAILNLADESAPPLTGRSAGLLLGRDPVFAKAAVVPSLLALAEFLVGRGMLLSQLIGSVRHQGPGSLGLHADNSWFPAPFPAWETMCTACWVTDEFSREAGATLIIPGTHKLKRHPPRDIRKSVEGAVAIVAPKGSLVLWDGSVWHGNYPRQLPGERVVLHLTYTRIGLQPVESYAHLDDHWLAANPPELADLLGRRLFFSSTSTTSGATDPALLQNTYRLVHGRGGY